MDQIKFRLTEIEKKIKSLRYGSEKKFQLCKFELLNLIKGTSLDQLYSGEIERISPLLSSPTFLATYESEKKEAWKTAKVDLLQIIGALDQGFSDSNMKIVELLNDVTDSTLQRLEAASNQNLRSDEVNFYEEVVKCYEIGAFRSAIIMMWNLALNHLYDFVLAHKTVEFNSALTTKYARRAKFVSKKEDFANYRESEIIEVLKIGGIIDKNVRKILDQKLGIRNTFAHPSTVIATESKVVDIIEDLLKNVIEKFQI